MSYRYHVYYIEDCLSKVRSFRTLRLMNRFVDSFKETNDNCLGLVIIGSLAVSPWILIQEDSK